MQAHKQTVPYVEILEHVTNVNDLLISNPDGGEIFQSQQLMNLKSEHGWTPEIWKYTLEGKIVVASVLTRKIKGFGGLAYIMRGPGVIKSADFNQIAEANKKAFSSRFFMIKMEPPILESEFAKLPNGLVRTRAVQPNAHTILIDLTKTEDQILASFRQRARREIKAGIKEGLVVKKQTAKQASLDAMYELYKATSVRAGFAERGKDYHQQYWREMVNDGNGDIFFVYSKDDEVHPIAGAFIAYLGHNSVYKDGGSVRSSGKHFAHLLQWEIMKYLKQKGVHTYDLHGVPPSSEIDNPNHPLAGLAMFKLSFSSEVTDYIGAVDQVFSPSSYKRWIKWGQKLHRAYLSKIKQDFLY